MSTSENDPVAPADPPKKAKKAKKSLRRRLFRWLLVLVLLGVILRVALPFLVPVVLDRVMAGYDLTAEYDDLSLSILGGQVQLTGLTVRSREDGKDGKEFARLDYLRGHLDIWSLLSGPIHVHRLDIDGVFLDLERAPDGTWPLLDRFAAPGGSEAEPEKPSASGEVDLNAPLRFDAIQVLNLRMNFKDGAATPAFVTDVLLNVSVADIGSSERPASFNVTANVGDVVSSVRIHGSANTAKESLELGASLNLEGLRGEKIACYLAAIGFAPLAEEIDLGLKLRLSMRPDPDDSTAVAAHLNLNEFRTRADGVTKLSLGSVSAEVRGLGTKLIRVTDAEIADIWAGATLTDESYVQVLGFEIRPLSAFRSKEPAEEPAEPAAETVAEATPPDTGEPGVIRLEKVAIKNVRAEFIHGSLYPPHLSVAVVDDFLVTGMSTDDNDPPARLMARLHSPNLAEAIRVDGTVSPLTHKLTADIRVEIDGLTPAQALPYLELFGLIPEFERGSVKARATIEEEYLEDSTLRLELGLYDCEIQAGKHRHAVETARIREYRISPSGQSSLVGALELTGLDSGIRIDPDGVVHLLGFRTATPKLTQEQVVEVAKKTVPGPPESVTIGRIALSNNRVRLIDETIAPTVEVVVQDFSLVTGGIRLGTGEALKPVKLELGMGLPGYVEKFTAKGWVAAPGNGTDLEASFEGRGLNTIAAEPYLRRAGLTPEMSNGNLSLKLSAKIREAEAGTVVELLRVSDLALSDADEDYVHCSEFRIDGLHFGSNGTRIDLLSIVEPKVALRRDPNGRLHAFGLAFGTDAEAATPPTTEKKGEKKSSPSASFHLGALSLTGGSVALRDERDAGPRDVDLRIAVASNGVSIEADQAKADIDIQVNNPETGGAVSLKGLAWQNDETYHAELQISGEKLGGNRLTALLPKGMAFDLVDGRLSGQVHVDVSPHAEGGRKGELVAEKVSIRDGPEGSPVFGFDEFRICLDQQTDKDGRLNLVKMDEITLTGLTAQIRRSEDGSIRLLGLTFLPAGPDGTAPAAQLTPKMDRLKNFLSYEAPPLVLIRKVLIDVNRISYLEGEPGGEPLVIEEFRFENREPIEAFGDREGPDLKPILLHLSAKASPFIESVELESNLTPFADPPAGEIRITVEGIRGGEFAGALPILAKAIDLEQIQHGRFAAKVEIQLKNRPQRPFAFDIERGLDILATDLVLASPDTEYFSCRSFELNIGRITDQQFLISSIEVFQPRGRMSIEKDGIRVLGILLRSSPESTDDAPEDAEGTEATAPAAPAPDSPAPEAPPSARTTVKQPRPEPVREISIDNLYVSGLEFDFQDLTVSPPVHYPLKGTDLEVRRFSLQTYGEDAPYPSGIPPFRFQISAQSDKVLLPVDKRPRSAFSEITLTGQVSKLGRAAGWLRASIIGLELSNLTGLAASKDVTLTDGILELGMGARVEDDGSVQVNSTIAFRDLRLTEPEGGYLAQTLALPFSTDMAIFLLRDHTGTISFPLNFTVPPDGMSPRKVTGIAVAKASELIAKAAVKSPLRVTASIVGIVGIGRSSDKPEEPVDIGFEDGDTRLTADGEKALQALIRRTRRDDELVLAMEHYLGSGDVKPMAHRASPAPEDCRALVQYLRLRQRTLLDQHAVAVENARASLASGLKDAKLAGRQLRAIDRNLGNIARELDEVLQILRPGAERREDRRTRMACVALGRMRIEEIARRLRVAGIDSNRVRYRRPRYEEPDPDTVGRVRIQPGRRIDAGEPEVGDDAEGTKKEPEVLIPE